MLKKINIFYIVAILLTVIMINFYDNKNEKSNIYNDDNKILDVADSYSFGKIKKDINQNKYTIDFSSFYGKYTIARIDVINDTTIKIKNKLYLKNGKFKLCLIYFEQNKIITLELSKIKNDQINISKGNYAFVIVGNNASGQLQFELQNNEDIKINFIE